MAWGVAEGGAGGGLAVGEPVVDVLAVGAAVGEPFVTLGALEGFLPTVQSLVLRQVVLVLESLVAFRAFMWTQVCKIEFVKHFQSQLLIHVRREA